VVKKRSPNDPSPPKVRLETEEGADIRPRIQIEVQDQDGRSLHVAPVEEDGTYAIPDVARKKAHRFVLGPAMPRTPTEEEEEAASGVRHTLRADAFLSLEERGLIPIGRAIWESWIPRLRCVTGRVRRCRPGSWWFDALGRLAGGEAMERVGPLPVRGLDELLAWPFRCAPVCDARVEVYRRTCCCRPWIVGDPRLPDLLDRLEDLIPRPPIPDPPFPAAPVPASPLPSPGPQPLPGPSADSFTGSVADSFVGHGPLLVSGTLDPLRVHAAEDARVLRSLPAAGIAEYINARPYLLCAWHQCSAPVKVAEGELGPEGRFNICWLDFRRGLRPNCHDRYAFVVRQRRGAEWVTLHDGPGANQWHRPGEEATLTTYHPGARTCRRNPGDAFVFLNYVGQTGAWHLHTPPANSSVGVTPPPANGGLLFPGGGVNGDRNWGGTLRLNLMIGEGMRSVGARYYRVSVATADVTGAPVDGSREAVDAPVSWFRSEADGSGGVDVVPVVLGPFTVGGQNALYRIPFDSDGDWDDGQFHALLDTTDPRWNDPSVRHLVTVEIFDEDGRRLRPTGTPSSGLGGAEGTASFSYRRRHQETGPTQEVPFGALTHLFWWDNRDVVGGITDLRRNGMVFHEECLYLTGTAGSTFGVGYRAYHPNQRFQRFHRIHWRRGMGGTVASSGFLEFLNSANVGLPPAPPGASETHTFQTMLRPDLDPDRRRCSFTVFLRVYNKRTDGSNMAFPYVSDSGAFSLELGA
jgi:hypothetical protein